MMVKRLKICLWQLVSCAGLLFFGCDDHVVPTTTEPQPLQNERLILASDRLYGFLGIEYNQNKMPTKYVKDQLGETVSITYAANQCTFEATKNGQIKSRQVYQLKNGVAEQMTHYSANGNGQLVEVYIETYTYKEGKLDKETRYQNGQLSITLQYHYVGEDISSVEAITQNGSLFAKEIFEYTDMLDKSGSLNQWNDMNGHLFPKKSQHLQKSHVVEQLGVQIASINYTYVLDAQGYVTAAEATDSNGNKESWTNTWQ